MLALDDCVTDGTTGAQLLAFLGGAVRILRAGPGRAEDLQAARDDLLGRLRAFPARAVAPPLPQAHPAVKQHPGSWITRVVAARRARWKRAQRQCRDEAPRPCPHAASIRVVMIEWQSVGPAARGQAGKTPCRRSFSTAFSNPDTSASPALAEDRAGTVPRRRGTAPACRSKPPPARIRATPAARPARRPWGPSTRTRLGGSSQSCERGSSGSPGAQCGSPARWDPCGGRSESERAKGRPYRDSPGRWGCRRERQGGCRRPELGREVATR